MKQPYLVFAAVVTVVSFFIPLSTFAATITVPGNKQTIQAAVNAAAPGDTIVVAPGTYPGRVTINKSVILKGANAGIPGNSARGAESIITGDSTGALEITANAVTVDGFTISSAFNDLSAGVYMQPTQSGALITNNIISGNQIGMYANSSGPSTVSFNLFDSNNDVGSLGGGTGIFSEFSDHMVFDHNEFRNHTINIPVIFSASGPDVHKALIFSNNFIHDNVSGLFLLGVLNGTIINNDISAPGATAMSFGGGGNANIQISGNKIHNSSRGVRFEDVGFGFGDDRSITITRNSITNNGLFGVVNTSGYSGTVDATCNWWGAFSGPGGVKLGSGDAVSSGVNVSPWLTSSDLTGPCNGVSVATTTVKVTIDKFIDGVQATPVNASLTIFPMTATLSAPNLGTNTTSFPLSAVGFNSSVPYEAISPSMSVTANYTVSENIDGTCVINDRFALVGYTTGNTKAEAEAATPTTAIPTFTNLSSDKFVIVWNKKCPPPATTATTIQLDSPVTTIVGTGNLSKSITIGSNTSRLLLVTFATHQRNGDATSMTFGGVPLTRIKSQVGSFGETTSIWALVAPATGVGTLQVQAPNNDFNAVGVYSLFGVKQSLPSIVAGASGSGTSASLSIAVPLGGDWVIDSIATEGVPTPGSSQTKDWTVQGSAAYKNGGGSHVIPTGATTQVMQWNLSLNKRWNQAAVVVEPVAIPTIALDSPVTTIVGTGNLSKSITIGSNTSRLLLVTFATHQRNGDATSMTFGGVPLTRIKSQVGSFGETTSIWALVAPATGVGTLQVQAPNNDFNAVGVYSLFGVKQSLPSIVAGASGSGTSASLSIAVPLGGDWVIDSIATEGVPTPGSSQTKDWTVQGSATYKNGGGSHVIPTGAATQVMQWNLSLNKRWNQAAVVVEHL